MFYEKCTLCGQTLHELLPISLNYIPMINAQKMFSRQVNTAYFQIVTKIMLDWFITVHEVLETAWGFRVKAKKKVCVKEDVLTLSALLRCFNIWALHYSLESRSSLLVCTSSYLYASNSKPKPSLCPPPFTFLPSIRPERVSFTPAGMSVTRQLRFKERW